MAVFWDLSFEGGGRVRKFENVDVCQNDVAAKNCTHHILQRLLKKWTEHSSHLRHEGLEHIVALYIY